jgi:hypothetical protein
MDLAITPVQFPKTAVRMKIDISVILDEKAIVRVSFYENDNEYQPLDVKVFHVDGLEYKAWGTNDDYIKNIVYTKLGINPA